MHSSWSLLSLAVSVTSAAPSLLRRAPTGAPVVNLKNGSYYGVHNSQYNQDFFLGIPFAQPPVDELRFANPESVNSTWTGALPATNYAFVGSYTLECVGYGGDQIGYQQSEDCLYLNVVRPSGYENVSLPMLVWIHGGGFYMGGAVDRRYNQTFLVENSVKIGKPIMAASVAYRLGPFGFLNGDEVAGAGQTNIGLKDQRKALQWLQENAAAFGADTSKITIQGESAGAASVGFQLTAFNGRDDKLFRGAIMQSGNAIAYNALNSSAEYQPKFSALSKAAGCGNSTSTLDCLRALPFTVLNNILNTTDFSGGWNPALDGDFIARYGSEQLADGHFVKVPIIEGANSDEGVSFSPLGINSTADIEKKLNTTSSTQWALNPDLVEDLLRVYTSGQPDYLIPSTEELGQNVTSLGPQFGPSYRASAAYFGDEVFIANRRKTCEVWAAHNVSAYSYRFNAIPTGSSYVAHFQEVAFVFNNLNGLGYAINPFANKSSAFTELSDFMSKSWVTFVHDLNPNGYAGKNSSLPNWPVYSVDAPQNMVFDANVTSHAEPDTWRAEGIKLINDNMVQYHR
ncbi:alpha/beta-hydrolase [Aureobasidium sp. EXF-8845]|nr:alpha/beta-hydrolase [Aureobasidium sp. EXF-8845]